MRSVAVIIFIVLIEFIEARYSTSFVFLTARNIHTGQETQVCANYLQFRQQLIAVTAKQAVTFYLLKKFLVDVLKIYGAKIAILLMEKGRSFVTRWHDYLFSDFYDPYINVTTAIPTFFLYKEVFQEKIMVFMFFNILLVGFGSISVYGCFHALLSNFKCSGPKLCSFVICSRFPELVDFNLDGYGVGLIATFTALTLMKMFIWYGYQLLKDQESGALNGSASVVTEESDLPTQI
uniref:Uncharacterized protein n=1 Tax=Heterorhabditis bacteriophora TaxID=37862 RepID=A0A1I7WY47_HETBA